MVWRHFGRIGGGRRDLSFETFILMGCEDVEASDVWKESDTGISAACTGRNLGGVDIGDDHERFGTVPANGL